MCTYVTCALRVQTSFRGRRLVRGTEDSVVVELGTLRSSALTRYFAGNDSAQVHGRRFVRADRENQLLTFGGVVLGAVGLAQSNRVNGLSAVGASLLVVSLPFQHSAESALSRAVWWYNAKLPATAPDRE